MNRLNGLQRHGVNRRGRDDAGRAAMEELRTSLFRSIVGQVSMLSAGGGWGGGGGGYDTARVSRTRPHQVLSRGGSADAFLDPWTRERMRSACRELDRNSSIARGLVQRQQDLVVADGFALLAKTPDREWNRAAEWLFNRCAGEDEDGTPPPAMVRGVDLEHPELAPLDIRGEMCLSEMACEALRAWSYEGDIGYLRTFSGGGGRIQLVEAERIQNPGRGMDRGPSHAVGGKGAGGGGIVGGVEMDAAGRPIRYHIASWDSRGGRSSATTAVEAEHFRLLRNPLRKLAGSTRGEPTLQAAVRRLEHLEAMDETVLVGMRLQNSIAAFIQLENPQADIFNAPGEVHERDDGESEKWEEWESGLTRRLGVNEKVVFPPPSQPAASHEPYILMQILLIGAEMGLPLPVALLDGRQVNLSTIRCISQVGLKRSERLQKTLKRELFIPIYLFKVARFIQAGLLPYLPQWMAHEWMAPPPPVMDPTVELAEARGLVDARIKSKKRIAREKYGINTDDEDDDIEREQRDNVRRGISPVGTPGASGPAGPAGPGGLGGPGHRGNEDRGDEPGDKQEDEKK